MNTSPRVSMPCQKEPNQFNYADNTSRKAIDHTTNQDYGVPVHIGLAQCAKNWGKKAILGQGSHTLCTYLHKIIVFCK